MLHDKDFQRWLKEVMSKILENLGLNDSDARYELPNLKDNIMSTTYNMCVRYEDKAKGESVKLSMILKKPPHSDYIRRETNSDRQFNNEILFYRMYAQPEENFPKCFYADHARNSVIALENMNAKGFYLCAYTHDVPLEYTLAAMRELGRFHGKGYEMKELQREKFFKIVNQLQEVRYYKTGENIFRHFCNVLATHGLEYLRRHGYDANFCDRMEVLLTDAFTNVMLKSMQPLEPLSTLCHGDCTLYNMLFRAEGDGQHRAMLIDFAFVTYATPVVDLSTYLCICCSNDIRKDKFSEIMQAYHDALKKYLQDAGVWNDEKYSYDVFLDNYKWGALFGFVLASFQLIFLKGYSTLDVESLSILGPSEYGKLCKQSIDDKFSKILADMLLQLKDLGCLINLL
ncbi:hypothetical protein DMN91_004503 [Ooceraea biroi]|uniref:CHK kinase-like domain-containing protein n=1 Tax=Ooceraea biroi TaxID=2015173 RepID=A0A026WJQ3_OOCBI|nr:uncharacterized protein LOC113561923 [Ooceraea biroi]EZA55349.1 hypothetical protein X777_04803 [Ooceraea biroi]RLU22225.1 hypothetical protein DMN91_004503 [Ooceraea biroi]